MNKKEYIQKLKCVSFDTAKILKLKGFNLHTQRFYTENGDIQDGYVFDNWNDKNIIFSAPYQALVQQWLRDKYNKHIYIYNNACGFGYSITKANSGTHILNDLSAGPNEGGMWDTYEEALEVAIYKCLTFIK